MGAVFGSVCVCGVCVCVCVSLCGWGDDEDKVGVGDKGELGGRMTLRTFSFGQRQPGATRYRPGTPQFGTESRPNHSLTPVASRVVLTISTTNL